MVEKLGAISKKESGVAGARQVEGGDEAERGAGRREGARPTGTFAAAWRV